MEKRSYSFFSREKKKGLGHRGEQRQGGTQPVKGNGTQPNGGVRREGGTKIPEALLRAVWSPLKEWRTESVASEFIF